MRDSESGEGVRLSRLDDQDLSATFCDILRLGWCSARCLAESTQSFSERTLLLDLVGELRRFIKTIPRAMTGSPTPWSD